MEELAALATVVILVFLWWTGRASRLRKEKERRELATRSDHNSIRVASTVSADDQHIADAMQVASKWESAREVADDDHEAQIAPLKAKVARAREIVSNSGVDQASIELLEKLGNWPAWSESPAWTPPVALEAVHSSPIHEDVRWVSWRQDGAAYRLELSLHDSHFDSGRYGDLKLAIDGSEVLSLDVSEEFSRISNHIHVAGVSAFVAGPWMAAITELAGSLRAADEEESRKMMLDHIASKAKKIVLE